MKKILTLLAALTFLVFGGACFTPELYKDSPTESRSFTEEISSFLITQDGKQLIVAGKQHHYIFAANDTLKFILGWPENNRVKATFYDFVIKDDQSVSGSYMLSIDASQDLALETKELLISKGFTEHKNQKQLYYYESLHGTRYLADKFAMPTAMQFNQKYTINMRENYASTAASIGRILLTPLAVAADGVLIIGGIPLLLLAIPIIAAQ
jgi:hypothetical protein